MLRSHVILCLTSTVGLLGPRLLAAQQWEFSVLAGYVRPSSIQSVLHRPAGEGTLAENIATRQEGGPVAEARVGAWWSGTGVELGVNRAWSARTTMRTVLDVTTGQVQTNETTREGATMTSFSLRVAKRFPMTDDMMFEPALGLVAISLGGQAYNTASHDAVVEPNNDLSLGGIAAFGVHYDFSERTHLRVTLEDSFTRPSFGGKARPPRPTSGVQSDLSVMVGLGFTR